MTRFIRTALLIAASLASPARADHIDPYDTVQKIYESFKAGGSYQESRAMFSQALRDARHDGKLDPGFAILYAMYSDLTRYDGNPAFALQLADEGIALTLTEVPPDENLKNTLLVSRAYALAELGQYQQAVEGVAITALWMGKRFGEKARTDLEAMARGWAEQAAGPSGAAAKLPAAVELSTDLLVQAQDAFSAKDTRTAIMLASRAMLPDGTGLRQLDVDYQNSRVHMVLGASYFSEGRHKLAIVALRRAADLLSISPWDGKTKAVLRPEVLNDVEPSRTAWLAFSYLASSAAGLRDWALCAVALESVEQFATTPERRFALLSQRATIAFHAEDYGQAEEMFRRGEGDAVASGDALNAALARMYIGFAHLAGSDRKPEGGEDDEVVRLASAAADAAGDDNQSVEYILTTAARMVVDTTSSYDAAMPLARRAFAVFKQRQDAMSGYDAGQDANRRERRNFLEMLIAGEYAAAHPK